MSKNGTQKSHTQIPKLLMKGFSFPETIINQIGKKETPSMIYKLNNDGIISKVNIKKENTEYGYYDEEVESKILSKIEQEFGAFKARLNNLIQKDERILYYNEEDVRVVKRFCSICILRSRYFVKETYNNSFLIKLFEIDPHNDIIKRYNHNSEMIDEYIKGMYLTYVKNNTKLKYILPKFYLNGIKRKNDILDYYIPITPNLQILLTTESTYKDDIFYFGNTTEENVDLINRYSIESNFKHSDGTVYAQN